MKKYCKILSTIIYSALTVTLFSSVSFFPLPVVAATPPACETGKYYAPPRFCDFLDNCSPDTVYEYFNNLDGGPCTPSTEQHAMRRQQSIPSPNLIETLQPAADAGKTISKVKEVVAGTCSLNDFNFSKCIWNPFIAGVGSVLITAGAWFLAVAGVLFNWTFLHTVIQFKSSIYDPISGAVDIGWTASYAISVIGIIWMLIVIAISIELGLKTFGQKKLVATGFVMAVLISFSLLFTKMIIDVRDYTAAQFYAGTTGKKLSEIIPADASAKKSADYAGAKQVATAVATGKDGLDITAGYAQVGIAGEFTKLLGVVDIADTYQLLVAGAQGKGSILTLVHGVFSALLLFGTGIALFYGSFILIASAALLIFLMMVSPLAFASHLIPQLSEYGWSAWWQSLLGNAVLAPMFVVFLWFTLQVSTGLQEASGGRGTLGHLISADANGYDIQALFNYLLVLGLLFASIKLASKFSSAIGGLNYAQMATAFPVDVASRFAGWGMRQTVGRVAAGRASRMGDEIRKDKLRLANMNPSAARDRLSDEIGRKMQAKARADTTAGRRFDLMRTGVVRRFAPPSVFDERTRAGAPGVAKPAAAAGAASSADIKSLEAAVKKGTEYQNRAQERDVARGSAAPATGAPQGATGQDPGMAQATAVIKEVAKSVQATEASNLKVANELSGIASAINNLRPNNQTITTNTVNQSVAANDPSYKLPSGPSNASRQPAENIQEDTDATNRARGTRGAARNANFRAKG